MCFCDGDAAPACDFARAYVMSPVHEPAALHTKLRDWWARASEAERQDRTVAPSTPRKKLDAEKGEEVPDRDEAPHICGTIHL